MKLRLKNESLFDQSADAIIVSIDGVSKGMGGKVARMFEKLYPVTWQYIESQVDYPLSPGICVAVPIPVGNPFKYILLATTLLHLPVVTTSLTKSVTLKAYSMTLTTACSIGLKTLRCGLPTGGWRVDPLNAFIVLTEVLDKTMDSTKGMELQLCIPDKDIFDSILKFATNTGFDL